MIGNTSAVFSKMIGTLAVILVVSAFIGDSAILPKVRAKGKRWKFAVIMGLIGGAFGIYGNISGFNLNGAVISVRDIGPMLAGFTGGPLGGLIAGLIAGVHRLSMGGITAQACVVATCLIGLICGAVSDKYHGHIVKPANALVLGACMEALHLCIVLIMVKPFSTAVAIVWQIAVPFIFVNAVGFALMIVIMNYTERQRTLTMEKSRLKSELEVANVIQHSLLPLLNEDYPGCEALDVVASMEAAKEVGGDFYDVFYVDSTRLAFLIGDVSGKGIPAALFMASAKITLQNCIRDNSNLAQAVEIANNALCARNEAEMFVTMWVGVLDFISGELTYICAGHNPPVIMHENKATFLKGNNGFVLAGMEDLKYQEQTIRLVDGDIVYLYTDGVTEAEDANHNLFGEKRLLDCFSGKSDNSATDMIANVKDAINEFINGNSQFDDLTMLCFKWRSLGN